MPRLPQLLNIIGGTTVCAGRRIAFAKSQPAAPEPITSTRAASANGPNCDQTIGLLASA
jgi:hypothetical protein